MRYMSYICLIILCRNYGAFGQAWLGKAYFALSAVVAMGLVWRFGIFGEGTTSQTLLRLFFRGLPIALLWQSTSCKDLAALMLLIALNSDALSQWLLTVLITSAAARQTPTYEYSGQAVRLYLRLARSVTV